MLQETRHKRIKLGLAVAVPLGVLILLGLYKRASYLLQVWDLGPYVMMQRNMKSAHW